MDKYLRGEPGTRVLRKNVKGVIESEERVDPPKPGNNVYLTLDARIQYIVEQALRHPTLGRAAAVVIDPNNGDILAMATVPSYDPNTFIPSVSPADWKVLNDDETDPLTNRAVQSYAPGSTYKLVTALAGLKAKLPPTRTFSGDQLLLTVAGVRLQLLSTPGETMDAISVWLPDKRVLMPGDDFLRAFPNISPIRGARLRIPEDWIASLEKMIELGPEYVVPSHTRPVVGGAAARAALTAYRDGIKSIVDQTIQGMSQGERPDELVRHVKLPPDLAANPYLQEFYGSVAWTVRGIYADRVGWFDGNATKLYPLPEKDRAAKLVGLIGGPDKALARGREALSAREFTWAAELADYVLANDGANAVAKRIKAQALIELGERQINAIARNYYLSSAMHLLKDLPPR
jgi:glyoxylase-like metal-dependent hydrolase (beta-lactamase superfamily II)